MDTYPPSFKYICLVLWIIMASVGVDTVNGFQDIPSNTIASVAWSPDGTKIAVGGGVIPCDPVNSADTYAVQILNAQTLQLEQRLYGNECDIYKVAWSPDGTQIAAAGIDEHGTHVWNVATGQLITTQQQLLNGSIDVAWYADGTKLAVVTVGNSIITLDANLGETLDTGIRYGAGEIDFSPDGTRLLGIPGGLNVAYILDTTSQNLISNLTGHTGIVTSGTWSPDGQHIATGSADNSIRIWDTTTFQTILTLQGHTDQISQVVWSPDGTRLASSSYDGTVRIWDVSTGYQIDEFTSSGRIYTLDWNPTGTQLAYGGSGNIEVVSPSSDIPTATPTNTPTPTPIPPSLGKIVEPASVRRQNSKTL